MSLFLKVVLTIWIIGTLSVAAIYGYYINMDASKAVLIAGSASLFPLIAILMAIGNIILFDVTLMQYLYYALFNRSNFTTSKKTKFKYNIKKSILLFMMAIATLLAFETMIKPVTEDYVTKTKEYRIAFDEIMRSSK